MPISKDVIEEFREKINENFDPPDEVRKQIMVECEQLFNEIFKLEPDLLAELSPNIDRLLKTHITNEILYFWQEDPKLCHHLSSFAMDQSLRENTSDPEYPNLPLILLLNGLRNSTAQLNIGGAVIANEIGQVLPRLEKLFTKIRPSLGANDLSTASYHISGYLKEVFRLADNLPPAVQSQCLSLLEKTLGAMKKDQDPDLQRVLAILDSPEAQVLSEAQRLELPLLLIKLFLLLDKYNLGLEYANPLLVELVTTMGPRTNLAAYPALLSIQTTFRPLALNKESVTSKEEFNTLLDDYTKEYWDKSGVEREKGTRLSALRLMDICQDPAIKRQLNVQINAILSDAQKILSMVTEKNPTNHSSLINNPAFGKVRVLWNNYIPLYLLDDENKALFTVIGLEVARCTLNGVLLLDEGRILDQIIPPKNHTRLIDFLLEDMAKLTEGPRNKVHQNRVAAYLTLISKYHLRQDMSPAQVEQLFGLFRHFFQSDLDNSARFIEALDLDNDADNALLFELLSWVSTTPKRVYATYDGLVAHKNYLNQFQTVHPQVHQQLLKKIIAAEKPFQGSVYQENIPEVIEEIIENDHLTDAELHLLEQINFATIADHDPVRFFSLVFERAYKGSKNVWAQCVLSYLGQSLGDPMLLDKWSESLVANLKTAIAQECGGDTQLLNYAVMTRLCLDWFGTPEAHLVIGVLVFSKQIDIPLEQRNSIAMNHARLYAGQLLEKYESDATFLTEHWMNLCALTETNPSVGCLYLQAFYEQCLWRILYKNTVPDEISALYLHGFTIQANSPRHFALLNIQQSAAEKNQTEFPNQDAWQMLQSITFTHPVEPVENEQNTSQGTQAAVEEAASSQQPASVPISDTSVVEHDDAHQEVALIQLLTSFVAMTRERDIQEDPYQSACISSIEVMIKYLDFRLKNHHVNDDHQQICPEFVNKIGHIRDGAEKDYKQKGSSSFHANFFKKNTPNHSLVTQLDGLIDQIKTLVPNSDIHDLK